MHIDPYKSHLWSFSGRTMQQIQTDLLLLRKLLCIQLKNCFVSFNLETFISFAVRHDASGFVTFWT